MANVSVAVEIETRIERDLSIAFQGVADDQSVNVGTLLGIGMNRANSASGDVDTKRMSFGRTGNPLMTKIGEPSDPVDRRATASSCDRNSELFRLIDHTLEIVAHRRAASRNTDSCLVRWGVFGTACYLQSYQAAADFLHHRIGTRLANVPLYRHRENTIITGH